MIWHIMKEEDLTACQYCGRELTGNMWRSLHLGEMHYKSAACSCGKQLRQRVRFLGTGHDGWARKRIRRIMSDKKTIESIVALD